MKHAILSIALIGICFPLTPNTLAQDLRTAEPAKNQSEAINKESDAREVWRWKSDDGIGFHTVAPTGDLLVSSGKATMLLSSENGRVLWTRNDMFRKNFWANDPTIPVFQKDDKYEYMSFLGRYLKLQSRVPGELAIKKWGRGGMFVKSRSEERLLLVELETGKDVFDTRAAGIKQVHDTCRLETENIVIAFGEGDKVPALGMAFDLSAGKTLWTSELPLSKKMICLSLDGGRVMLVNGESAHGKRHVLAIESSTGRVRWESVELARNEWGKSPAVLAMTNSSAVVFVDKSGPVSIDLRTGAVEWRNDLFSGEPAADALVNRENMLFLAREKKLAALDLATGKVVWKREGQAATHLIPTRHGLLMLGSNLQLLRYETGEPVWPKSVSFNSTAWLLHEDTLFQIQNKKLHGVAIETGVEREFGAVEFQGGESPTDINLLDDTLLVTSSQNIVAFARAGQMRYHRFYQAPGLSGLEKTLMIFAAAGMTYLNMRMAASSARAIARDAAFLRGGTGTGVAFYHAPILGIGPYLATRIHATTNAERFIYMFTEQPDSTGRQGFSLVRLDKRDGRETGRIWSQDRRPNFSIDQFASRVFIKTGDAEITAYAFATMK